jgi:hypothetical protein
MRETPLFPGGSLGEGQLVFMAGFHLGVPLSICMPSKDRGDAYTFFRNTGDRSKSAARGWDGISAILLSKFKLNDIKFEICGEEYAPSISFPLGKPLLLRYRNFNRIFQWRDLSGFASDDLIWVCPSGVVLIMGRLHVPRDTSHSIRDRFDDVIDSQMPQLTYVFSEVAEIILSAYPVDFLASVRCSEAGIKKCRKAIEFRNEHLDLGLGSTPAWEHLSQVEKDFLEDVLIDIYYIDFLLDSDELQHSSLQVRYIDSSIHVNRPQYLLIIAIVYSSFVGLLAFQRFLGEKVNLLHGELFREKRVYNHISAEIKLLGAICLEFIDESEPTRIHLMRSFMECVEECWRAYRMYELTDQVRRQITTLDKMAEWIDQRNKEERNLRIAVAAVILALISITAVAAQLVSTIDVTNQLGRQSRIGWIVLGFCIGMACTTSIYCLPLSKYFQAIRRFFGKADSVNRMD